MRSPKVSVILDKEYLVKFDWNALAELRELYGEEYSSEVYKAVSTEDVKRLAEIISIGTGGEITAQEVMDISPELTGVVEAIRKGLNVSYFGETEPKNPLEAGVLQRMINHLTSLLPRKKQHLQEA